MVDIKKIKAFIASLAKNILSEIKQNSAQVAHYVSFILLIISVLFLIYLNRNFFYQYLSGLIKLNLEIFIFLVPIAAIFLLIYLYTPDKSKQNALTVLSIFLAIIIFFTTNYQKKLETGTSLKALNALNCETAKELNTTSTDPGRISIKYVTEPYTDKEMLNYLFDNKVITQDELDEIFYLRNQMELSNIVTNLRLAKTISADQGLSINNQIQNFASIITAICKFR